MGGTAPVLVFGYGNPSRGDDALGPLLIERLRERLASASKSARIEFLTDFQLQVEHALDLSDRDEVIFADASLTCDAPFEFQPIRPRRDASFTSHSLSPASVLFAFSQVVDGDPPPAYALAIRGNSFELGDPLSAEAARNLDEAVAFLAERLSAG